MLYRGTVNPAVCVMRPMSLNVAEQLTKAFLQASEAQLYPNLTPIRMSQARVKYLLALT